MLADVLLHLFAPVDDKQQGQNDPFELPELFLQNGTILSKICKFLKSLVKVFASVKGQEHIGLEKSFQKIALCFRPKNARTIQSSKGSSQKVKYWFVNCQYNSTLTKFDKRVKDRGVTMFSAN